MRAKELDSEEPVGSAMALKALEEGEQMIRKRGHYSIR